VQEDEVPTSHTPLLPTMSVLRFVRYSFYLTKKSIIVKFGTIL